MSGTPPPPSLCHPRASTPFQIRPLPGPHVAIAGIPPVSLLPLLGMVSAFPAVAPNGRLHTPRGRQMASSGRYTTL
jgi:hypothetical protein